MTHQDDVKLFMRLGGQEYPDTLTVHDATPVIPAAVGLDYLRDALEKFREWNHRFPQNRQAALSVALLVEEVTETVAAILAEDIEEIADGLVDIGYIHHGIAARYGIDYDAVWDEVHSANLAKFPEGKAERDANGKVVKPEGWVPPNIARALGIE